MAENLEDLADYIGLNAEALISTITNYNASCAEGADWNFFKSPENLIPLTDGPYYAIAGKLSTDGAFGGILVDSCMRVLTKDGTPFKGLYAAGDIASGRHIVVDGIKRQVLNDMSWALSSGFLAGESVVNDL